MPNNLLDSEKFIPLANIVAGTKAKYFIDPTAHGSTEGAETAARLGLHAYICAGEHAESLAARYPDFDIYDGDARSFFAEVLPKIDAPAIFWLDPEDPGFGDEMEMLQTENVNAKTDWFVIYKHEPDGHTIGAPFDTNWAGPEELKPRVYRSQNEKDTWHAIVVDNEYRVGPLKPEDVVIDLGAHIGAFSFMAQHNGSRNVVAFELEQIHYDALKENLRDLPGIELHRAAVVRGDEHRAATYYANDTWNAFETDGEPVDSVALDDILSAFEKVRLLKTDIEGGEWPVLYTCKQLYKVQEIAGEYHLIEADETPETSNLPHPFTIEALSAFLEAHGFEVEFVRNSPTLGNFYAKRVAEELDDFAELGKELTWLNSQSRDNLTTLQLCAVRKSLLLWNKLLKRM